MSIILHMDSFSVGISPSVIGNCNLINKKQTLWMFWKTFLFKTKIKVKTEYGIFIMPDLSRVLPTL